MDNYNEFPPLNYFTRVLKTCPKSALLYLQIWEKRGPLMAVMISKKEIRKDYLISPTMFRNLLTPLMVINVISFFESDDHFQIEIFRPHVNDE